MSNSTGTFTLRANATTTSVTDDAVTASSTIVFSPTNAHAANDMATTSIAPATGSFLITHANNARADRTFVYANFISAPASSAVPIDIGTLGTMKERIADELARADLTTEIAYAINDAISYYRNERFHFNESRDLTFSTVADQEFYDDDDLAQIPWLQSIDYIILYIGSIPWPLHRRDPIELETLNQNGLMTGQPWNYAYYNEQLRLGPVPDAVYSMRIAGRIGYPSPSSDTESSNPWMTDAEKLIRSRAKWELFTHVIRNGEQSDRMRMAELDAFQQLKGKANRLVATGRIQPMAF